MATKKASAKKAVAKASKAKISKTAAGASESPVKRFRALIVKDEGGEVCAIQHFPFDVEKTFGVRGRVPVRGTLNGAPFRASIFRMCGEHFMVVNRQLRAASGVRGGETVTVTVERDDEPRVITPPADFERALKGNKDARATWDKLSYTHQREHVQHIEEAKRPETRERRIEKSIETLAAGKKEVR